MSSPLVPHRRNFLSNSRPVLQLRGIAAAALTSGTLSATGDTLAQALVNSTLKKQDVAPPPFDAVRTLRMFGFGFLLYGPFQHWWYAMLSRTFPGTAARSFLAKVTLNQVVLGPLVLSAAFAWNLGLRGQAEQLPGKMRRDLVPTMVNGWKFWVPAACLNFYVVPLRFQVLYMSVCGVLWTGYLSFASYNSANAIVAPTAAAEPAKPKRR